MKEHQIPQLKADAPSNSISEMLNIYELNNQYVYNSLRTLQLLDLESINQSYFKYYTVERKDTWASISYKIYGTISFYWLILKLNSVKDPMVDPVIGEVVKYIDDSDVRDIVNLMRNSP
jgi:LysM repeat protein